jgi:Kef-type K+ transport system membrane component KefB
LSLLVELLAGILLGNLFGIRHHPILDGLAQAGAILLLFEAGLASSLREMMRLSVSSFVVAALGMTASLLLGFAVAVGMHAPAPLFVAATLAATSVGISARVFQDLKALDRVESRIVLGAAVIDDVLALVLLSSLQGSAFAPLYAVGFLVAAIGLGRLVAPYLVGWPRLWGLALCALFAWLSFLAGLSPIVGAFAAGLVLEVKPNVRPLALVLVPIFFIRMGAGLDLRALLHFDELALAGLLSVAAIAGKQLCGLGAPSGVDRWTVGLGMVPRGEVSLIVADAGRRLAKIDDAVFSAVVLVVMVTTVMTALTLRWRVRRLTT